jgi:gamma-glutamyltranspeptidase/glutathione hydrolase
MGETFRNPDFAATLRHLAEKGPDDFYHGELAAKMTDDLAANGSFVTKADFQNYKVRDNQPVMGSYRGYEIASGAAPHGGPTLLAILNILEGYDLAAMGHNSAEYIYTVAMAMKAALPTAATRCWRPDFVDVPLDWMMSKERAAQWRARSTPASRLRWISLPPAHRLRMSAIEQVGQLCGAHPLARRIPRGDRRGWALCTTIR